LRTTRESTEKPAKKKARLERGWKESQWIKTHIGWVAGEEVGRPGRVPSIGGQIIDEIPDGVAERVRNVGRESPGTELIGNCSL
jgi:hypothetical protein